jgi:translation initiation factor 5
LTSFILKNPPATAKGGKKKAMANAGASTSAADGTTTPENGVDPSRAKTNGNGKVASGGADDDGGSDDELTRRIQAEAQALPSLDGSEEKEETWTTDVSEEAVRARQRQLESTMALLNVDDDEDDDETGPYNELGEWIEAEDPSDIDIYKKMVELGVEKKHRAVQVLAQTLFTEDIVSEIPDHVGLLKKLTSESKNHEKAFLGGIERLVGVQYPDKVKDVPAILFKLYDLDIVSEEVIEKWGSRASKKYVDKEISRKVRKAAKPFLTWLAEAESESDDE